MSTNKTTLQSHNTRIQSLIDTANSLPDAGSGEVELPTLSNEGTAADLLSGKQLIGSDGNVVTGTIATKTASNLTASGKTVTVPAGYYASNVSKSVIGVGQATPSITVSSEGIITATSIQQEGYVSSGTTSATRQLATQAAKTWTPTTSNQVLNSGQYLTGSQIIEGDYNLIADNIKAGVSIFGVTGNYEGSGGGSGGAAVETCTVTNYFGYAFHLVYYDGTKLVHINDDVVDNSFTVAKNSIIAWDYGGTVTGLDCSGSITHIVAKANGTQVFFVTGDGVIKMALEEDII